MQGLKLKEEQMQLTGVILAAGKGIRMLPFSDHYPKPILPVCNKPILAYQIEAMKRLGIDKVLIVVGHLGYKIVSALGDGSRYGVKIKYVDQGETLGIAHALYKLENKINTPFLLFLGDIFFITQDLKQMVDAFLPDEISGVLATKTEKDPQAIARNFSVILDNEGYVKRLIEKPKHVHNNLKGCGIYLFGLDVFDALRRTPRTAMRDEYEITDAIQIMVDDEKKVIHSNIIKEDINLTYPADLLSCNFQALKNIGERVLVGEGGKIHEKAEISDSIIGSNVTVNHGCAISRSLIFDNVNISSNLTRLDNVIITPFQTIQC